MDPLIESMHGSYKKNGDIPASYVSLPEGILSCISTIQPTLRGYMIIDAFHVSLQSKNLAAISHLSFAYIFADSSNPQFMEKKVNLQLQIRKGDTYFLQICFLSICCPGFKPEKKTRGKISSPQSSRSNQGLGKGQVLCQEATWDPPKRRCKFSIYFRCNKNQT